MAVSCCSHVCLLKLHAYPCLPNPTYLKLQVGKTKRKIAKISTSLIVAAAAASPNSDISPSEKTTKLVTFLGKGGSGKTTAAVFAAQHYAEAGFSTCLVTHSLDRAAEYLLNCKIGTDPTLCSGNLSAVRLETTKMLLDPLKQLKEADARINLTQGVLEGVVVEELGVLPGMDTIFSALALANLVGLMGIKSQQNQFKNKFDVVVYDGVSPEETLRMMSAASNARLYVKYLRSVAEKTDIGRLISPSILRLVDETTSVSGSNSGTNGKLSSEIWDSIQRALENGASSFRDPQRFGCYIVADPSNPVSVSTALRFWGCVIQAGANVSGAFGIDAQEASEEFSENLKATFSPLPFALIPNIWKRSPVDLEMILSDTQCKDARNLLHLPLQKVNNIIPAVKFDPEKRCVTLFIPGFNKSEIKLYQYRGGSELLIEAGDQRRVIVLPRELQGKVGGAKFTDRMLSITMR